MIGEVSDVGIEVIGIGSHQCKGLHKGVVVNIDKTATAIREAVTQASQQAACQVESVFISVSGQTRSLNSTGMVSVRGREIGTEDVSRVLESARSIPLPTEQRIIHTLPQDFIIDGQEGVKDPVGMSGVRLETKVHVATAGESNVQNLLKCTRLCDLEVEGLVLDQLAGSMAVLQDDEKELGVAFADIGGGTVNIIIYVEESVMFTAVLPLGSWHITKDIAVGLNTPIAEAERIKQKCGCASIDMVEEDDFIDVPRVGGRPPETIPRRTLCGIIQPRVEQIFDFIHRTLEQSNYIDALASGLVISGGGSILTGMPEFAESMLQMPVRRGVPGGVGGMADMIRSPMYATGTGILMYASKEIAAGERTPPGRRRCRASS
ncbi:MAG: cell division protein FtsA [Deltaproteobacteria bacterium]|nr:cell division protein FtsA [Deltaproteobacteria bacterium]